MPLIEKELTGEIIGAAIEVHKNLGPGLLESVYEKCLSKELAIRNIKHESQKMLPVEYKGIKIDSSYRIDIVVDNKALIELKAVDEVKEIHKAQLLTYLKLTRVKVGLLINFNVPSLKDGIHRFVV